jgi:hypothetical protein
MLIDRERNINIAIINNNKKTLCQMYKLKLITLDLLQFLLLL